MIRSNPRPPSRSAVLGLFALVAWTALLAAAGCDDHRFEPAYDLGSSQPPFGATQGGVQDMRIARELVAAGKVPPAAALRVEGMFSEHDLPLEGGDCTSTLCIGGALGWQDDAGWLQLGLSSDIDPGTFVRPSGALVLLVDVSGSMGWSYGEHGLPAAVTRALALELIERFDAADRIGIATFASTAAVVQDLVPGDQHDLLAARIGELAAGGSTNMEAGLGVAHEMFAGAALEVDERRVILLTDANPNTGATSPGAFMTLAAGLAADGIGLTVIGTGIGLDPTVMQAMLDLEGGNGFSIASADRVAAFMDENWPWMVCPIAHALVVEVAPAGGFEVTGGYGFPGDEAALAVASVFLSQRRGALLVRLGAGEFPALAADLELRYTTPDGEPHRQSLSLSLPAGAELDQEGRFFAQYSAQKSTALALLVDGMREAAELYGDDHDGAVRIMETAHGRFAADAAALLAQGQGDAEAIERERELAVRTLELMREGAAQGTLYGWQP